MCASFAASAAYCDEVRGACLRRRRPMRRRVRRNGLSRPEGDCFAATGVSMLPHRLRNAPSAVSNFHSLAASSPGLSVVAPSFAATVAVVVLRRMQPFILVECSVRSASLAAPEGSPVCCIRFGFCPAFAASYVAASVVASSAPSFHCPLPSVPVWGMSPPFLRAFGLQIEVGQTCWQILGTKKGCALRRSPP